jgi:hypothetical protein
MSLSTKTLQNLSIALTPEVICAIHLDSRWHNFMTEIIHEIVTEKLGSKDVDLVSDLSVFIMDNLYLKSHKTL